MIGSDPGQLRPPLLPSDGSGKSPGKSVFARLGLIANPFPDDPGAGPFIETTSHSAALTLLNDWWSDPASKSLALVTGHPGSGKSRLLIEFRNVVARDNMVTLAVLDDHGTRRSDAQLLREIVTAFGGAPNGRTGLELQGEVRQHVVNVSETGSRSLVLIDAANFSGSQLEILRSLLTDSPARIVLFGEPDLPDRIARRRSLATFVGLATELNPLDADEIAHLIRQRIATNQLSPGQSMVQVKDEALAAATDLAGGNPGVAVRLMHATLIETLASGRFLIDWDTIIRAQHILDEQGALPSRTNNTDTVVQTRFQLPGFEAIATPPAGRRRHRSPETGGA